MTTLNRILDGYTQDAFATRAGLKMHARLQRIVIPNASSDTESDLVDKIKCVPGLSVFFDATAKTEVPVAGYLDGCFLSRRIDRLRIDTNAHKIDILDYKTDTDKSSRHDKYVAQIKEYVRLLKQVYPDYTVAGYILWTHDFSLEKVY